MSYLHRFELFEAHLWTPKPLLPLIPFEDDLSFAFELLNPNPNPNPSFSQCMDLFAPFKKCQERMETEMCLQSLSDRIAAVEMGLGEKKKKELERKYKWSTEIKGEKVDKKFKWAAEAKGGEKNFKWTAEVKGKGEKEASKIYSFEMSTAELKKAKAKGKEEKLKGKEGKEKKGLEENSRFVEIEETDPRGAVAIRKAFANRTIQNSKGKRKELSPHDAALIIQMTFKAHLVRRSQVVRGLRELAVAKAKLKEIRSLFYNFSYRRRIAIDAEERQRFSEKIIVLLLTVDSIEGPDYMVRAARRSMVGELESMLDAVDPQPAGKLFSMKRRKFDLPVGGPMSKEMAMGVAKVVQLLDDDNASDIVPDM